MTVTDGIEVSLGPGVGVIVSTGTEVEVIVVDWVAAGLGVAVGVSELLETTVTTSGSAGIKPSLVYGLPSKSW